MSAADLSAYADAIQRRLSMRRGGEHVLSPRDFDLVRQWHRAAVPLARVLAAIDGAAEAGDALTLLAPLRGTVAPQQTR